MRMVRSCDFLQMRSCTTVSQFQQVSFPTETHTPILINQPSTSIARRQGHIVRPSQFSAVLKCSRIYQFWFSIAILTYILEESKTDEALNHDTLHHVHILPSLLYDNALSKQILSSFVHGTPDALLMHFGAVFFVSLNCYQRSVCLLCKPLNISLVSPENRSLLSYNNCKGE